MVRIVQVGLGPLGEMMTTEFTRRGLGELVAVVDPARTDIPTRTLEDIDFRDDVDCVLVTTRSSVPECMPTFLNLLERGQTVVSTCEDLPAPDRTPRACAGTHDPAVTRRVRGWSGATPTRVHGAASGPSVP